MYIVCCEFLTLKYVYYTDKATTVYSGLCILFWPASWHGEQLSQLWYFQTSERDF